jgi:hypothetical protein
MYHYETIDPKTKKTVTFEDTNFKIILKTVLQHENGKYKNDEDAEVIIENHTGDILQTVSEKFLKHILGIQSIRKTSKLEKSTETFNGLNMKDIATITFKNKIHEGIITIWEDDNDTDAVNENTHSGIQHDSEDELDAELAQAMLEREESESEIESVHVKVSSSVLVENKRQKEEILKLKEQIELLKGFVSKYRDMSLKINKEASLAIKLDL